jgi:hypothetical protein
VDTVSVDGTDLATLAIITDVSGAIAGPAPANAPIVLPHRRGGIYVASEMQPYSWDLPLAVVAASRAALASALASLAALLDSHQESHVFTRSVGGVTATSVGMLVSAWQPQIRGEFTALLPLTVMNLDGCWYTTSDSETVTTSGTVTLPGTLASSRITLTLSGDAGPQTVAVTETTTSVTFSGASDVNNVVIDVESMTATRNAIDVSGLLSHSGAAQGLIMLPGANTVTLTGGGSVDVVATGAVR